MKISSKECKGKAQHNRFQKICILWQEQTPPGQGIRTRDKLNQSFDVTAFHRDKSKENCEQDCLRAHLELCLSQGMVVLPDGSK